MSIRIATTGRIAAWLEAGVSAHMLAYAQRTEDALSIERHKVRTLQSQLADALEANEGLRQSRAMDGESMASLATQLTAETALVEHLAVLAFMEPEELGSARESVTKWVTDGESLLRRAFGHPSFGPGVTWSTRPRTSHSTRRSSSPTASATSLLTQRGSSEPPDVQRG